MSLWWETVCPWAALAMGEWDWYSSVLAAFSQLVAITGINAVMQSSSVAANTGAGRALWGSESGSRRGDTYWGRARREREKENVLMENMQSKITPCLTSFIHLIIDNGRLVNPKCTGAHPWALPAAWRGRVPWHTLCTGSERAQQLKGKCKEQFLKCHAR